MRKWKLWLCWAVWIAVFLWYLPGAFGIVDWPYLTMKILGSVALSGVIASASAAVLFVVIGGFEK